VLRLRGISHSASGSLRLATKRFETTYPMQLALVT